MRRLAVAALILVGGTAAALADPPGRVGRLSYMEGTVSFHAADQQQWTPATLNWPVTTGNSFWTEPNSRAEIQIGPVEIRMDETTAIDVIHLDDGATQLQVDQGVVNLHVRAMPPGGVQIATPRGTIELLQPGSYHIDAGHPDGDRPADAVQLAVLEGDARIDGPRSRLDVQSGEAATISGDPVSFSLAEANTTPFDDWALQRERREAEQESVRYVSPEMTGAQDLDGNGRWQSVPNYGPVWVPTAVPVGWAPYRYGHWAFVPPWGWTWVDDAPWGFAPFHYGRWVEVDGGWAWWPGAAIVARPVYAPALVAFVGGEHWGVSLSVGVGIGAVGWVPLAPFEPFHPYYRTSPIYVRNVNVTTVNKTVINNITNVNNVTVNKYVNQQATTIVPATAMANAASVQHASLAVPGQQLAQAPVTSDIAHVRPSAAARAGIATQASASNLPAANTPATIAKGPVATNGAPAASDVNRPTSAASPAVPKAPGPALDTLASRGPGNQGPGNQGQGNQGQGNRAQPHRFSSTNAPTNNNAGKPGMSAPPIASRPVAPSAPAAPSPSVAPGSAAPGRSAPGRSAPGPSAPGPAAPGPAIVHPNNMQPQNTVAHAPNAPAAPAVAAPAKPTTPNQPQVAHNTIARSASPRIQARGPAMPAAQVQHPAQQTQLKPTQQGWQRQPSPPPAMQRSTPTPAHAPAHAPASGAAQHPNDPNNKKPGS